MKKKLLLADDSITIQKVVGIIFATEDYELLSVSNGDQAFELALTHHPDLVIADIIMPGKDGFELCRAIKSHPALGTTSVLLLPGAFEEFDEARAVEVCADGWLTKPFESQALIDKVSALLEMPPLRLVTAEETAFEDELAEAEEVAAPESAISRATDLPFGSADEEFFAEDEPLNDVFDAVDEGVSAAEDADGGLWGEVSFEEEDLKPQQLLAASDQDDDEPLEMSAEDDDLYAPPQGLTAEQLAPYVSTPITPTSPPEHQEAPEFEPLSAEKEKSFEFVVDQPDSEDEAATEVPDFAGSAEMAESAPSFEYGAEDRVQDDSYSVATSDDAEEVFELMEEDLEQEQELVEDSATFLDLPAVDEDVADEAPVGADVALLAEEEIGADDEILDLTEGDVLEEEEIITVAPEEMASFEALAAELDDLYEESLEQFSEEDDTDEVLFGRRDDDLFSDDDENVTTATAAVEFAGSAAEDEFETAMDEEELVAAEPEGVEAEIHSFKESAVAPPVVAAGAALSAAMVEEQLRQLPEEEIARIVEKVAGPLIERLTRDMLEQVVWEVVPDLAETMIRAEIEKIKRGEA